MLSCLFAARAAHVNAAASVLRREAGSAGVGCPEPRAEAGRRGVHEDTTRALSGGFGTIFLTGQTYAMVAAGGLARFWLESACKTGIPVAAQPGLTGANPVLSTLGGTLSYGEAAGGGVYYIALAVVSAAVTSWVVPRLSRSPLVAGRDEIHARHRAHQRDMSPGPESRPAAEPSRATDMR